MVEADPTYPDQIDDIVNRASQLFVTGLLAAKNQSIDIAELHLRDEDDLED